jgi:serine/threonine-protein kinase
MHEPNRCRGCGQVRPVDAPGELCPLCLLRTGAGGVAIGESRPDRDDLLVTFGPESSSILDTLRQTLGRIPQVHLRGGDSEAEPVSGPHPPPDELPGPADPDRARRLRLFGVIGRSGMGVVLKGHDADLGRDLAVKVLREPFRDQPEMVWRFIEEAQIGGQLQHPGVVPVYELGTLADRRPYFAMKLIRGRTLAEVLADRAGPADDHPRLLGIFESVCQTMAYAHARGVIHRDLKPSNIMVGRFGEVQVMDWGLAKVLIREDAVGDPEGPLVRGERPEGTAATARGGADGELSMPGSVMGTPAYMAPEQARGDVDAPDERADVFALGSILCEILTGAPAFVGANPAEIERRSARGEVAGVLGRLAACGADAELVELAGECVAAEAADRPRDAQVVARRVGAYRIGVLERLHAAELARVEAQARAEEEAKRRGLADALAAAAEARADLDRRRRRLAVALAASVVALVVCGGGGLAAMLYQRQARLAQVAVALRETELLRDQAAADPDGDLARWQAARGAVQRLHDLRVTAGPATASGDRIRALEDEIERGATTAAVDRRLVDRLEEIRGGMITDAKADAAFAEAFRGAGLDVLSPDLEPAAIGRRLAGRPRAIALETAAALDTWAVVRGAGARSSPAEGRSVARRLLAIARVADPDPWRAALRDALAADDPRPLLRHLAEGPDLDRQGPVGLWLLGHGLEMAGDHDRALDVLRRAHRRYPGDYWLNTELGLSLLEGTRSGLGVTNTWIANGGDSDGRFRRAEPYFQAAVALRPRFGSAHLLLATACLSLGKWDETFQELDEALRLQPDDPTIYNCLGLALASRDRPDEAAVALRKAIRLFPEYGLARANLGDLLLNQGRLDEAAVELRDALRVAPDAAPIHARLGLCLATQRKREEAVAAYREAIRLAPQFALAHANLAATLRQLGDFDGAKAGFRTAFELYSDPQWQAAVRRELERTERQAVLAPRLDAVLGGDAPTADAAEALELAYIAHDRQRFAGASRLFDRAFQIDSRLADDLNASNRYNAACSAALAAAGRGRDEPRLDDAAKARLRLRAYRALERDLAAWSQALRRAQPSEKSQIHRFLAHWKVDPDLEGIREPEVLAKLPEPERNNWQALWTEVDSLLRPDARRR